LLCPLEPPHAFGISEYLLQRLRYLRLLTFGRAALPRAELL
jgi:hypothetical protein